MDAFPREQKGNMVAFVTTSLRVHWHSMRLWKRINGQVTVKEHSAHDNNTLCVPNYYGFLCWIISALEEQHPGVPILIHRCLFDHKELYDDKRPNAFCRSDLAVVVAEHARCCLWLHVSL